MTLDVPAGSTDALVLTIVLLVTFVGLVALVLFVTPPRYRK